MTKRSACNVVFGAVVAACLCGCGKSHPTESVKSAVRVVTPSAQVVSTPNVNEPAAPNPAPKPLAMPSSAEPGIPFGVWLRQMRSAISSTSTASASVPANTEPDLHEEWLEDLRELTSRTPAVPLLSTAPAPAPSMSPLPALSSSPVMQPVVADMGRAPLAVDKGEAMRRAEIEQAARRRFELLASTYGAGPGYTGVGAGVGYTGVGAGDGFTGAGAGDGYTGVGGGDGFTGITGSSAPYPTTSISSSLVVVPMLTPYGFVPVAVQP
jgi:hypothetical protein